MKRTSWLRTLAIVGILALGLAACPDDADAPENGETPGEETPGEASDDDALHIGYILPETGQLAFLGPAQIRSVEMAIQEANDAGGVLGNEVQLSSGDEAGDAAVASQSADRLLAEGVHAIVGAAASGMSLAIIDQVTGAGVVQCSASNTSPTFTDYDDDDFYFRTAPSDALQGPVLAEVIAEDGHQTVAILARADDYGRGLAEAARSALEEQGADVPELITYDPEAATFDAEVSRIADANVDAVALISFDEGVQILQTMIEQGLGPDSIGIYGADGIRSEELNEQVEPGNANVIDGMKGTAPDPGAEAGFEDKLDEFAPDLEVRVFAPQAYDCTNMIMLAAESAGSTDPSAIRDAMLEIVRGDNECADFGECKQFLDDGETISYQTASGVNNWADAGEPLDGTYEVWEWTDGALESIDSRDIQVEEEDLEVTE